MEVFGVEVNCCKLFQFADALKVMDYCGAWPYKGIKALHNV